MKNKIKTIAFLLFTTTIPIIVTSCSTNSDSENKVQGGALAIYAVQGAATVQSVDPATRVVVLLHPDGTTSSYECGPEVRNFYQIKVGDQVTATMAESVAIALVKGGMLSAAGTTSAMVSAPLGAKPSAKKVDTIGFTAKVISVDEATRKVTLQTPDGQNETVEAGPNVDLTQVNPGDDVAVKLTRAFAITVTEPGGSQ